MSQYRIEDEFAVSVAQYWDYFFDPAYNHALFKHLEIEREEIEFRTEGSGAQEIIYRTQNLVPKRALPPIIQRFVTHAISYQESNIFHRKHNRIEVVTTPNFMADKIITRGSYAVQELPNSRVLRVWEGICQCKIPLVGKKIEQQLIHEIRRSYGMTTEFTRQWIEEHPPSQPTPT